MGVNREGMFLAESQFLNCKQVNPSIVMTLNLRQCNSLLDVVNISLCYGFSTVTCSVKDL